MVNFQRYDCVPQERSAYANQDCPGMEKCSDGDFMLVEDHEQIVREFKDALLELKDILDDCD